MTDNIYWILKADIGEGNIEELKSLTQEFSELTGKEEGAIAYEWSISEDNSKLNIYERYKDSNAGLVHLGNVGPKLPELMALVSITAIECYGSISDQFREATKDFPMVFMNTYAGFHK